MTGKICFELNQEFYQRLGLTRSATKKEIKSAYRRLAKRYHPDSANGISKDDAEESFKQINEAYAVLSDPQKRRMYDVGGYGANNFSFHTSYSTYSPSSKRAIIQKKLSEDRNFSIPEFAYELRVEPRNLIRLLEVMIRKKMVSGKIKQNQFIHVKVS